MKLLLFAGSLRNDSLNKKLVVAVQKLLPASVEATVLDIQTLNIPLYNGDIEQQGIPPGVQLLATLVQGVQGVIISSPEYNGSISSPLKNTIDWLSRLKPVPLEQKPVLLLAASPGTLGGVRGLLHGKVPLEVVGSYVYPQTFGLAKAHEAFTPDGTLEDPKNTQKIKDLTAAFVQYCQKLN